MFDLDAMDTVTRSEEGVEFPIMRVNKPTEQLLNRDGSPVFVTLLGPDSATYRRAMDEQNRKMIETAANAAANATPVKPPSDKDDGVASAIAVLAACTKSWTFKTAAGDPIPCTMDAATKLYEAYPAIRDQLDVKIGRRVNFLPASSNN